MSQPPDDDALQGETVELSDDDEADVIDTADGGALVKVDDEPKPGDSEFYRNLAEDADSTGLNTLATKLLELVEEDRLAREKRDEQYEEGLRRTGLGDDAPGGAQFQGASRVVHPMLTEVSVDFSSKAIKELFPAGGPVKSKIIGRVTKDREAKAARKADFMNWQLTVQCKGVRQEFEQILTQLPMGGAQYMKMTWDRRRNRPKFLFVPIDEIYLPYAASNFYTAERKTHVQQITQQMYEDRVASGMYCDVGLTTESMTPERTKAAAANDKIEGKEDNSLNVDGLRIAPEIYLIAEIEWDEVTKGESAPYIVTVDQTSTKVLSIYRNWDEDDETREELVHLIEFPFIPWRGPYPIGMTQMIGGLSGAATGALRALLDAAHIANSQAMVKLKGGDSGGQTLEIQPTQIQEIEGGLNVDDIRKLAMPLPFNQPSQTLMELLSFLVDAGKSVVRTTIENAPDANPNVPVGTTLANIEQGMVVFNAIHARLHESIMMMLFVLHRLNGLYLDDRKVQAEAGDLLASRADFQGPMDVVPVSDPNIFSEAQRFAQVQAVAQRAQLLPQLYDLRAVEERILNTLKIPDPLSLLQAKTTPQRDNAVSENVKAALGKAIVAFPEQDHIAHLEAHIAFMEATPFGQNPLVAATFTPVILQHIKEHMVLWYADEAFQIAKAATQDIEDADFEHMMAEAKTPDEKRALDRVISQASQQAVKLAQDAFAPLPPVLQKAMAMMAAAQPPPPDDPAARVALEDVQSRERLGHERNAIDDKKVDIQQAEVQQHSAVDQTKAQLEAQQEQGENERAAAELATRERISQARDETTLEVAEERAAAHPREPATQE